MAVLTYNGVSLPYCNIQDFRHEAMHDESGTDWYLMKFDITSQFIVNIAYLSMYGGAAAAAQDPAAIMGQIRTQLLKPRKTLSVTFNGRELIPAKQGENNGTVDAKNGPLPQYCSYVQMTNETFLVNYRIIAHYWESASGEGFLNTNLEGSNVLYNRWSETQDIDQGSYSKIIREGVFVIRSDNVGGLIADDIRRQMAAVSPLPGCVRESSSYTVTPDGLGIRYRIMDKEVFKMPPSPSFEAFGEYTESAPQRNAIRYLECFLRLKGRKDVPQDRLLATCISVCANKVLGRTMNLQQNTQFRATTESAAVKVNMYENIVECNMRAMVKAVRQRFEGVAIGTPSMTWVPGTDIFNPNPPRPKTYLYGTLGYVLQAAAYYDPSLRNVVVDPKSRQLTQGVMPGQAGIQ